MLLRRKFNRRRRPAFTLMEMLVVVAIIVALAGISAVAYFALFEGAKKDTAKSQIKSLTVACDAFRIKNQDNPDSLQALLQKDPSGTIYVEDPGSLIDPWGKPYNYDKSGGKNQGRHADIWTTPPDGTPDIGNWPKQR